MSNYFDIHLSPDVARKMNRNEYYAARSWLRRCRRIIRLRFDAASIDPFNQSAIFILATMDILPERFQ